MLEEQVLLKLIDGYETNLVIATVVRHCNCTEYLYEYSQSLDDHLIGRGGCNLPEG